MHVTMEWNQISDYLILGTNLCCTSHAQELYGLGLTADIDLELERSHEPMGVPVSLWLPTRDGEAPSLDQLLAGTALLAQLEERKQLAYVHCQFGHGRSPTLVAAHFVRSGMSVDEAIEHVKSKRPEVHLEPVQRARLEEFARELA